MLQDWRRLTYVHWPFSPDLVQSRLPSGLEVDTHDGAAWVGLVPFHMENIAARFTPPIPYLGTFPETNVRTYVRGSDGPGVWFLSLDISRLLPVVVAGDLSAAVHVGEDGDRRAAQLHHLQSAAALAEAVRHVAAGGPDQGENRTTHRLGALSECSMAALHHAWSAAHVCQSRARALAPSSSHGVSR